MGQAAVSTEDITFTKIDQALPIHELRKNPMKIRAP